MNLNKQEILKVADLKKSKHIVCYSGGHSSAMVALNVVDRFGIENCILLNHNISSYAENEDIKRFKVEIAEFIGIEITYANIQNIQDDNIIPDQFDVCIAKKGFKQPNTNNAFCTYELKTLPFMNYLEDNFPNKNCIIYYGFDKNEQNRIQRRSGIMGGEGYKTDYPLALWKELKYKESKEIGILPPATYTAYKHANCEGCLKGGIQHWYVTFCHREDVFQKAINTEIELGYSILRRKGEPIYLIDLKPIFHRMKCAGVPNTEHYPLSKFKRYLKQYEIDSMELFPKPCECSF